MQVRGAPDGACQLCWALPQNLWRPSFVPSFSSTGLTPPDPAVLCCCPRAPANPAVYNGIKSLRPLFMLGLWHVQMQSWTHWCLRGLWHWCPLPWASSLCEPSPQVFSGFYNCLCFVSASFMSAGTPPWPRLIAVSLAWNLFLTPLSQSLNPKA